jgi:signal transduction histidine kinase/DNA-binding response OmpR family regulator/ligand-binding sensor domain-containing protein
MRLGIFVNQKKVFTSCFLVFLILCGWLLPDEEERGGEKLVKNTGFQFFKNYRPVDYGLNPQNYCILQDKGGVIYVGNNAGLLKFDGISWDLIDVPGRTVRSMAVDKTGTIFIGGNSKIGLLEREIDGSLRYASLLSYIDESKQDFGNVWKTHATEEGIYFYTAQYLFRWNTQQKQMDVWHPEPGYRFNAAFTCDGKFFVHQRGVGLMQVNNNSLNLIRGNETFDSVKIYMMAQYDKQKLLIGTRANGFFLYSEKETRPFPTEADEYLKKNQLYHGIGLSASSGQFALATNRGGLVIIDSNGALKKIFNIDSGLLVNNMNSVFEDFQGNLWLPLTKGISKIEYVSPFSIYDERSNLRELVLSVVKHHGELYAGTTSGLYFLKSPFPHSFRHVPGITTNCWSLLSTGDSVLAATTHGVFQVDGKNKSIKKIIDTYSNYLHPSPRNSNRIWVGLRSGLASIYLSSKIGSQNHWVLESLFEDITDNIITIVEDKNGNLWLGTLTQGILKVDLPIDVKGTGSIKSGNLTPKVTRYDTLHGIPSPEVHVYMAAGHVMFATRNGLFCFKDQTGEFIPDYTLGKEFAGDEHGRVMFRMAEDQHKNIWFHSDLRNFQATPNQEGTYSINRKDFLRLPLSQVNAIYPDPDGRIVWFASNYGLIRYDKGVKKDYHQDFNTIIRQVAVNGVPRIFAPDDDKYKIRHNKQKGIPVFSYSDRNLRFQFAALFFEGESETQYQYFLKGYDDDWSRWALETNVDYTNLGPRIYMFSVRAKNIYENISRDALFQFKILPPWYRTWWAYFLYAAAAFFGVFLLLKWRSRKLVQEKEKLEQVVLQRTQEIEDKNIQLQDQSEKLKEMDKIKSRFFANISHEFRTPLTLLMGPLEQMIADCRENEKEKKRKLTMMLRNAQRLLRLINQLLELSKLESGKMKLQAVKTHIVSFLKGIADSFRFMAHQKELDLLFHAETEVEDIILYIDPRKMEDIMSNLLINALKFTPPGGKITVSVKQTPTERENKQKLLRGVQGGDSPRFLEKSPPGRRRQSSVEISVSDTGPGIPVEQLDHIFDRFYQADSTYEFHEKGSGIGLALCKELVELHHGTITVLSREGEGSAFIIRLPIGEAHISPEERGVLDEAKASTTAEGVPALEKIMEEEENGSETEPGTVLDFDSETGMDEKNIILVVEDSADMRDYIRGALEPVYAVVDAEDGQQGIQKAQEIIPDLIISDIMMPGVDGYELCRVLKNDVQTSHIPIILLTARASEENILQGLETGADDYITKPFNTKILSARIKNLIDIRSQLQKNLKREMNLQPVKTSVSKIDREFLQELQDVIKKNLSDPEFNVEKLCKKLYMGNTTLYRKIQALCGQTPTEFIRSCRLKRAAQLLESGFGSVTEVAFEVGFSSRTYFTKCFKQRFQQLPSEYPE